MSKASDKPLETSPSLSQEVFGFDEQGNNINIPLLAIKELFENSDSGTESKYTLSETSVSNGSFISNSLSFESVSTLSFNNLDSNDLSQLDFFQLLSNNKEDVFLKINEVGFETNAVFRITNVVFNTDNTTSFSVELYSGLKRGVFKLTGVYNLDFSIENYQPDYNQTDNTKGDYIKNKPTSQPKSFIENLETDLADIEAKRIEENNKITSTDELDLSLLTTTNKSSIKDAINELDSDLDSKEAALQAQIISNDSDIAALQNNQTTGVVSYSNLADLPVLGVALVSYKVTNDSVSSDNNGYYTWNGVSYEKDDELVEQSINRNNTSTSTSGKAQYNFTLEKTKEQGISVFGINNIKNDLPQLNGYLTGQGFTFSEVEVDEDLPIDTNKIFRLNYETLLAESRLDVTTPIPLIGKNVVYTGWIRKTDLQNIPDQITFMIYTLVSGVNQDIIKLDYITPTDLVKGFSVEKEVGNSIMKFDVVSETNDWILFYIDFETTSVTANQFIPRIYLNNINTTDKLDFVNLTAYSGQDNVNILLPSLKTGEEYVSSLEAKLEAKLEANISLSQKTNINLLGFSPINNKLPQLSGFVNITNVDLSEQIVNEELPIDTDKIFRLNYSEIAEGRIDITNSIPSLNKIGKFLSWVRKSDLASLPNGFTIMMYNKVGSNNQDIIKLDYITSAQFIKGFHIEKTVDDSTLVLDVISETTDWVLFFAEITTNREDVDSFVPRFYYGEIPNGITGKIDFVNYTAYSNQDNIDIRKQSIKDSISLSDNFIDVETINIANSDTIDFVADSYTESYYTLKDKSYISKVSELIPYNVRNFAKGGDDIIEVILRIENNETRFGSVPYKSLGSKYTVIALYANDSVYRNWDINFFKENIRQLVGRLRDLGREPIIATEFFLYNFFVDNDGVVDTALLKDLADELQVQFIDVAQTSMNFIKNRHNDFWNGSHPATRTNSVMWKPISDFLKSLPRPKQSIKIYRNRNVEGNFFTDTLFKNEVEKLQKYQEIRIGHKALTTANEIYFDRQSLASSPIDQVLDDEYLKLQNKEAVSFDRHALIEVILPYTAKDVDYIRVKLDANKTVFPWIRKKKTPFVSTKGTAFKPVGAVSVSIGDTYLISSSNNSGLQGQTITITSNRDGYICALGTTYNYAGINTIGTLTKQSGLGDSTINFDSVQGCFADDYYDNFDKIYEWEQAPNIQSDGYIYIDNTSKEYVEGDKLTLLIREATTGFELSDISIDVPEVKGATKIVRKSKYVTPMINGTELISERKMGNATELSNWNVEGGLTFSQPIGNANPRWIDGVVSFANPHR